MAYAVLSHAQFGLSKAVLEKYTPATWSAKSPGKTPQLIELSASSQEYIDVLNKIKVTMPTISVSRVQRVQNPYLWGAYLLKKAENPKLQEMKLFHATAQSNIISITNENYDWRRTVRSKFGKGVSFSPSAAYADKYCNMKVGTQRAMILSRVLVGKTLSGSQFTEVPTEGYDTTTGNSGNVYVKYGDNDFYPEYVAYYSSSNMPGAAYGGNSRNNSGRNGHRICFRDLDAYMEAVYEAWVHDDDDFDACCAMLELDGNDNDPNDAMLEYFWNSV